MVEAGCKTVSGGRCKISGMFWSESGAQNILALRCIYSSRRLEDFWKNRLNEQKPLTMPSVSVRGTTPIQGAYLS